MAFRIQIERNVSEETGPAVTLPAPPVLTPSAGALRLSDASLHALNGLNQGDPQPATALFADAEMQAPPNEDTVQRAWISGVGYWNLFERLTRYDVRTCTDPRYTTTRQDERPTMCGLSSELVTVNVPKVAEYTADLRASHRCSLDRFTYSYDGFPVLNMPKEHARLCVALARLWLEGGQVSMMYGYLSRANQLNPDNVNGLAALASLRHAVIDTTVSSSTSTTVTAYNSVSSTSRTTVG